jgi:hypothetical protein
MSLKMILTGDVNLMNVTDPKVPFALVGSELRKTDVVFGNLECCLVDVPAGHSLGNEGFFADPAVGEALTSRIHAVGTPTRALWRPASMPSIARLDELHSHGAGADSRRAAHIVLSATSAKLPAAQLGLLADQPRGAQGRGGHRRDPGHTPIVPVFKTRHTASQSSAFRLRSSPGPTRRISLPSRRILPRCARHVDVLVTSCRGAMEGCACGTRRTSRTPRSPAPTSMGTDRTIRAGQVTKAEHLLWSRQSVVPYRARRQAWLDRHAGAGGRE